jgi:hypothetical protein
MPCKISCGPGGIRTPDLFSAIEARSQLRYRPLSRVAGIVPDRTMDVKEAYQAPQCALYLAG